MAQPDELADEVKNFIVTQLACWETPSSVAKAVKEGFGLDISRQRVEAYDPHKVAGRALSKEFRTLFEEARKRYLADTAEIGIANQTFRLRMLERLALRAEVAGNMVVAAALVEQAAKEMGGSFTNRREFTGKDGGAISTKNETPKASAAEVMDELTAIFGAAAAVAGEPTAGPPSVDPPVRDGAKRGGTAKRRAPKARKAVARKK